MTPTSFAFSTSRRVILGCLAIMFLSSCRPAERPGLVLQSDLEGLVVLDVQIVSPERSEPLEGAWVAFREGTITHLGSGSLPSELDGWPRVSGEGSYLTPGLIDAHVHLQSVPGFSYEQLEDHADLVRAYREQLPYSFLYYGFTTLIDLAPQSLDVVDALRERPLVPDILTCGPPIPLANGYPMVFVPEEYRFRAFPNFLYDPRQSDQLPETLAPEDNSPKAVVDRVVRSGGICAKTFVEDGFGLESYWPIPDTELLNQLAVAADDAQVPLVVHANSYDSYKIALEAEVDMIVHGLWTWDDHQALDDGGPLPPAIGQVVAGLQTSGTSVMPTLQVLAGDQALFDPGFLTDTNLEAVLPFEVLTWYRSDDGAWFAQKLLEESGPTVNSREDAFEGHHWALSRAARVVTAMNDAQVKILFGSDTPSGPSYGNPPGYNGFLEMQRLSDAGLSPRQVLRSATLDNARAFGVEDRYGTVEVGKVANLLLLTENPLESVTAYATVENVILRGQFLDRSRLAANAPEEPSVGSN